LGAFGVLVGTLFALLVGTLIGYATGILIGEYQKKGAWPEATKASLGGWATPMPLIQAIPTVNLPWLGARIFR
jgi:hypothetical protein